MKINNYIENIEKFRDWLEKNAEESNLAIALFKFNKLFPKNYEITLDLIEEL